MTDVVIVGAGVNGLAAARAIASTGKRVLVLERYEVGTPRASSHGASRIFRLSHETAAEIREAQRVLPLWRELEEECGEPLLELHGTLDAGGDLSRHRAALDSAGLEYELLEPDEVARRFRIAIRERAIFQQGGGIVRADRVVGALRRGAEARGAVVREGVTVERLRPTERGVEVVTDAGTFGAEAVVVAAGAWAPQLLRTAGIPLEAEPTRETVTYFRLGGEPAPSLIDWTVTPEAMGLPRPPLAFYALHAPGIGLKVGLHHSGPVTDPEEEGAVDELAARIAAAWVAERFPHAEPEPVAADTCIYTSNPRLAPVIASHGRVVVASACNGHGFKFAPTTGADVAALADVALDSRGQLG